jgi:ankyrin repeat protein
VTLFEASHKGDVARLRALLAKKTKVDARFRGFVMLADAYVSVRTGTALMLAAGDGHLAAAELLLDAGADVNAREASGWTPLLLAALLGHADVVRLLAERGADLSAVTHRGDTALLLTTSNMRQRSGAASALVELGADVNVHGKLNAETPLHQVAEWPGSKPEVAEQAATLARQLLKAGAGVAARDFIRRTPLHLAADSGNLPVARLLLDHGADVNAIDHENSTPLHEAYDHPAVTQILLEHGARPDRQTKTLGLTPLHHAVAGKQAEVIRLLAGQGAKLDLRDKDGKTPLAHAATEGDVATFELLLQLGARDPGGKISRSMAGKRLRLAAGAGDLARVRVMLAHKPDLNAGNWDDGDEPPLIGAAMGGHLAVAKALLAAGAKVDVP